MTAHGSTFEPLTSSTSSTSSTTTTSKPAPAHTQTRYQGTTVERRLKAHRTQQTSHQSHQEQAKPNKQANL